MALRKNDVLDAVKEYGSSEKDTGSAKVQIALLTKDIQRLTEHCKQNPHDFSTKRGLLKMVCRRRKFLRYLELNDNKEYKEVIERLGLRK